uniref:uncharacterized protein LOC122588201 n=1 Tax=Erigeron canadensis TaxID=72917 RepID=UPI001CB98B62|nr:uncharacterized protein LOC122588201 [Erigeron canadensis]
MGNPFGALVSGVGHIFGSIFGHPLDFLSGKSCRLCGPTWDLGCYIENFCIEHLIKFFAVSFLFYMVLVLLYIIYKLGVFHCIFKVIFRMIWTCFMTIFLFWENACHILFNILLNTSRGNRRRRRRDMEMADMMSNSSDQEDIDMEASVSHDKEPHNRRRRFWSRKDRKRDHMRKSLRPKNHRAHVGIDGGDSVYVTKRKHIKHDDVRVMRSSNHKRAKHLQKKS